VGHHYTPVTISAHLVSLDGFSDGSNLIDFEEKSVAGLFVNTGFDSLDVGHQKIIPNYLVIFAQRGGEVGVSFPIILVIGIFNGDDVVLFGISLVVLLELRTGNMRNFP